MKKNLLRIFAAAAAITLLAGATVMAHGGHGRRYIDTNNDGVCDNCGSRCSGCTYSQQRHHNGCGGYFCR